MRPWYTGLVTRFARLYFRELPRKQISTLDRLGIQAVSEVCEIMSFEQIEILKQIYVPFTKDSYVVEAVEKLLVAGEITLDVWEFVHKFEKAVAKKLELI